MRGDDQQRSEAAMLEHAVLRYGVPLSRLEDQYGGHIVIVRLCGNMPS